MTDDREPTFLKPGSGGPSGQPTFTRPQSPAGASGPVGPGGQIPAAPDRGDDFGFPPEDPVRPWPWYVSIVGFFTAMLAVVMASTVIVIVIGSDAIDDYDYLLGLMQDVLWVAVSIGIPLAMVRWIKPEHLGLRPRHPGWLALKGCVLAFGFLVMMALYAAAMGLDENSNELLGDGLGFGDSIGKDVAYALLYAVAAPVGEEILFRGVVFKGLRDGFRSKFGRGPAVALGAVISGALFGALHLGAGQDDFIPVLIALGVLLALAYEWSGTIYLPIVLHSLNNAISTGYNADPTQDWVIGLIAAGPVIALGVSIAITRFVRRLPSERPPTLPPSFPTNPTPDPTFGRPPGV